MAILFTVAHILACMFLIVVVLLQQGKGAEIGAVFGGSSSTIFGSSGAGSFLTKMTSGVAALFMVTSIGLTYLGSQRLTASVFDAALPEPPPVAAPAETGAASGDEVKDDSVAQAPAPEPAAADIPAPPENEVLPAAPASGAAAGDVPAAGEEAALPK